MERQLIRWLQRPLSMEGKILITKAFGLSQLIYVLQMCEIKDPELVDIERAIFKFIWNKKWVGSTCPDRIKRSTMKLPYLKGGLEAPDISLINKALKVKQFIRAMKTFHPINLIQKYQLEKLGYDEYFKCEYAKICRSDHLIGTYQLVCNQLTDYLRSFCDQLPLPDPDSLVEVISVASSTDVLEYLMRKKQYLLINMFGNLAIAGISSYRHLLNESLFPRNDQFYNLSKFVLQAFPPSWSIAINFPIDIDSDISYEQEFPSQNLTLIPHNSITVKSLRLTLGENVPVPFHPYENTSKFQLTNPENLNPFLTIRKFIHTPRDRTFKYRILQGDIFCNQRMLKFKMTNTDLCLFCYPNITVVESIKHILWDCPRSKQVWETLNRLIVRSYNRDYISYESIIFGHSNPIPVVEALIVLMLKIILTKDRTSEITMEHILNKIKVQFFIEQQAMKNKQRIFNFRWERLEHQLFNN